MPRSCTNSVRSKNEQFVDVTEPTSQRSQTDKKHAMNKIHCFLRINQDEKILVWNKTLLLSKP